jgi:hypothetical protein
MVIPALLILKCIEQDDKEIVNNFYPDIEEKDSDAYKEVQSLRSLYAKLKSKVGAYELYNLMEKCLIEVPLNDKDSGLKTELDLENQMLKHIRGLAL